MVEGLVGKAYIGKDVFEPGLWFQEFGEPVAGDACGVFFAVVDDCVWVEMSIREYVWVGNDGDG